MIISEMWGFKLYDFEKNVIWKFQKAICTFFETNTHCNKNIKYI